MLELKIRLSMLYTIGPASRMIIALTIRLNGYDATARNPIGSVTRNATQMFIIIAIAVGRVKNPATKNIPPINSVNMLKYAKNGENPLCVR